ncbi:MAG: hypothetical protein K0Q49_58 [Haloplasmataceae bacterium]|jgi:hypothetical protein|nr:hypothetical protein [Haloplasmataceae bacterium]
MNVLDIFRLKKIMREKALDKKKNQDFRIISRRNMTLENTYHNVEYNINPFIYVSKNRKEVKYVEDIEINYKELSNEPMFLDYIVRNPLYKDKSKKTIVDQIIKKWEIDYYQEIDNQLKKILDQSSYIPVKRIEKIKNRTINTHVILALLLLILLKQYSFLQVIPYIGMIFTKINSTLIYTKYYNVASIIVYLSVVIAMYLIIVKVYFDKVLKFGLTAKGFLIKERDRMLKKFKPTVNNLKKHLFKKIKYNHIKHKYEINNIYNSKAVVDRIQRYGRTVIQRVGIFTTYYSNIILISKILRYLNFGLMFYLFISTFIYKF